MSSNIFIQVYLDTSCILKFSQINDDGIMERKVLNELYELYKNGKIFLFTTQGSFSDIFGDSDEKIKNEKRKKSAEDREKTRVQLTFPLATDYIESKEDFDNNDIELFNIIFNTDANQNNVYEKYIALPDNDKVDFCILKDSMKDSNNLSFFVTRNPRDFIYDGKRERIEDFATNLGKAFKVRIVSEETLNEIKKDIE